MFLALLDRAITPVVLEKFWLPLHRGLALNGDRQGEGDVQQHPDTNGRVGTRWQGCPARLGLGQADRRQSHRADGLAAFSRDHDRHADDRDTPAQYKTRMQKHAEKILATIAAQAAGIACETVQVEHEHPYRAIIDTADSKGCDLIVMASHGRHGISAIVLGSETVKVLTHCKIPVLVHR